MHDKLNRLDYRWYVVRTRPSQERKLADLLERYKSRAKNILEVYAPTHTTVSVRRDGVDRCAPLFGRMVFVLATQEALVDFMEEHGMNDILQYERRYDGNVRARLRTIPEEQMRMFRDFNENYADRLVVLERPYSDYAFNPKTNEPNEIVRVVDGPLAGREGYIVRFNRDKRLVFKMRGFASNNYMTVSLPNVWNFHVVRIHNAEGDRQSAGTQKERAVDLIIGLLQSCGYVDNVLSMLNEIIDYLLTASTIVGLCQHLSKQGHTTLSKRIAQIDAKDAELILNLIRYENDNPGYFKANWSKFIIRPFLTPTSGVDMPEDVCEAELRHNGFTEIVRKVSVTEDAYYPSKEETTTITTTYYAHIGIIPSTTGETRGCFTLFTNWDMFLGEYFLTAGKANEKLVSGMMQIAEAIENNGKKEKMMDSFRNYAPTLYNVLTNPSSRVTAVQGLRVGEDRLNAMAITVTGDISQAKSELITTCVNICKEINTTTHLAVWRRYLRTVWLHS